MTRCATSPAVQGGEDVKVANSRRPGGIIDCDLPRLARRGENRVPLPGWRGF